MHERADDGELLLVAAREGADGPREVTLEPLCQRGHLGPENSAT